METVNLGWSLGALLVLLAVAAAAITATSGLGRWRTPVIASARAVVQLAVVSLVIGVALQSLWGTLGFIALMVAVATWTAGRRVTTRGNRQVAWLLVPIVVGIAPPLALAVLTRVVPAEPIALLPLAGILVGGAMTATSVSGRRVVEELRDQRGSYEAALAIGLSARKAVGLVARPAAALALVPGQDQTRTVGLVTLPGAFVGLILAGASPAEAGAAQVLILVALLAVQATAAALTVELVAAGRLGGAAALPVR
ncbi:ABC transporter permease [Aeromicrobium phragmitis]|uniref:ABC transporter permease n=1 Tax=Aeromicrobium phragmitis TaxID=2478914 RepID=A0A3L8PPY2_9ACTN|nr:ABC transporter permease [Aeromicrobium phragmitis]RLV56773.1 ABC transporter permease [Aeromicrobium phragmitis]